jgi:hypothetical protein
MQTFYQSFGRNTAGELYHQATVTDERLVASWNNDEGVKLVIELRVTRPNLYSFCRVAPDLHCHTSVRTIKDID